MRSTQAKPTVIRQTRTEKLKFRGVIHVRDDGSPVIRQRNRDVDILQRLESLKAAGAGKGLLGTNQPVLISHSIMSDKEGLVLSSSNPDVLSAEMMANPGKHIWVEATARV